MGRYGVFFRVCVCDSGAPNHISCQREDADEGPSPSENIPSLLIADVIGGGSTGQNNATRRMAQRNVADGNQSLTMLSVFIWFDSTTFVRKSEQEQGER